jgi:hypothetical protein
MSNDKEPKQKTSTGYAIRAFHHLASLKRSSPTDRVEEAGERYGQLWAGRYPDASAACGLGNGTRLSGEMSK